MASRSQFSLLRERRFAPLFWTQFLGAANDNLFKFAFTLLATYHAADWGGVDASTAGFVIGAIFIAPFVLLVGDLRADRGQVREEPPHPLREGLRDRRHGDRGGGVRRAQSRRSCISRCS